MIYIFLYMYILIKLKNIKNIDVCYVSGHNKVFQRSILGAYAGMYAISL